MIIQIVLRADHFIKKNELVKKICTDNKEESKRGKNYVQEERESKNSRIDYL